MGKETGQSVVGVIDNIVRLGVMFILAINFIIMGVAMWDSNNSQELYKGSFSAATLDRNWTLLSRGRSGRWICP